MSERDILLTMFDLGRQVTAVLDVDELLQKTPELIRRLIPFDAFAVYLLDAKRNDLTIAYAVGYPDAKPFRVRVSEGIVGRVVESQAAQVIGDVSADPHYIAVVPGMASTLAVPLIYKKQAVGA